MERGNFKTEHHAEMKKPNGRKKLNFDTLRCGNCVAMSSFCGLQPSTSTGKDFTIIGLTMAAEV
jgi:hypothetical protein